jgi:hypothetical protein
LKRCFREAWEIGRVVENRGQPARCRRERICGTATRPSSSQDYYIDRFPSKIDEEELMVLWLTMLKILDAVPWPELASFQ